MGRDNWSIYGTIHRGKHSTEQTKAIEKAAMKAWTDPKKFFQLLGRLPKSTFKGMFVHYELGFHKNGRKNSDWFSETAYFK